MAGSLFTNGSILSKTITAESTISVSVVGTFTVLIIVISFYVIDLRASSAALRAGIASSRASEHSLAIELEASADF